MTSKQSVDFVDPNLAGGSMLNKSGSGGEPLNVIISGLSSPAVLTFDGFLNYARSLGFSTEFLGIHKGDPQPANLGDGKGWVNEMAVIRQDYGNDDFGTLFETLRGGNHFRMYQQNGPNANTGAFFLATSYEKDVHNHHDIVPDGYNIGREKLVARASKDTKFEGVSYRTTIKKLNNLLPAGAAGVNHNIATDGVTALLTVTIL